MECKGKWQAAEATEVQYSNVLAKAISEVGNAIGERGLLSGELAGHGGELLADSGETEGTAAKSGVAKRGFGNRRAIGERRDRGWGWDTEEAMGKRRDTKREENAKGKGVVKHTH